MSPARHYYDIRDLFGHWVKPRSDEMMPCPHACCKGRRPHPEKLPVVFSKEHLRSLSEPELIRELNRYTNFTETHPRAFRQIAGEIDRRDHADRAAARRKEKYRSKASEYHDEVYRQTLQAEAQTNGYMLNKKGKAAGINPVSLFTGPESRVRRYASDELLNWFAEHGRPTRVSFMGSNKERREHLAGSRIY